MKQTFSYNDVEAAKKEGWIVIKENIIGGKIRTVLMEKEGDPYGWIDTRNKEREVEYNKLSKTEKRIRHERDMRYSRGLD